MGLVRLADRCQGGLFSPGTAPDRPFRPAGTESASSLASQMENAEHDGPERDDDPEEVRVSVRDDAHLVDCEVGVDPVIVVQKSWCGWIWVVVR